MEPSTQPSARMLLLDAQKSLRQAIRRASAERAEAACKVADGRLSPLVHSSELTVGIRMLLVQLDVLIFAHRYHD